jgi:hypothetical protein
MLILNDFVLKGLFSPVLSNFVIQLFMNFPDVLPIKFYTILYFQVVLPLLGGAIGGYVTILYFKKTSENKNIKPHKFLFVGAIAGFVAVNLLNPSGSFEQVTTIAILAGLNGMTFLSKNSLANSDMEKGMFESEKDEILEKQEDFDKVLDEEVDIVELVNRFKDTYNEIEDDHDFFKDLLQKVDLGSIAEVPDEPEAQTEVPGQSNGVSDNTKKEHPQKDKGDE